MLLAVDVGNTQTHFGAFDGARLVEHWRFATVRQSTADELGAALRNLLELRGCSFTELEASIVSSTVPQLEPEWTEMARRYLGHGMPIEDLMQEGTIGLMRAVERPRSDMCLGCLTGQYPETARRIAEADARLRKDELLEVG